MQHQESSSDVNYYNTQEDKLKVLEERHAEKVNRVISERVTPLYNTFILIFAAFFAYFIVLE